MIDFAQNVIGKQRQNNRSNTAILYALNTGSLKITEFDGLLQGLLPELTASFVILLFESKAEYS